MYRSPLRYHEFVSMFFIFSFAFALKCKVVVVVGLRCFSVLSFLFAPSSSPIVKNYGFCLSFH